MITETKYTVTFDKSNKVTGVTEGHAVEGGIWYGPQSWSVDVWATLPIHAVNVALRGLVVGEY
jgi:hypothetical protein